MTGKQKRIIMNIVIFIVTITVYYLFDKYDLGIKNIRLNEQVMFVLSVPVFIFFNLKLKSSVKSLNSIQGIKDPYKKLDKLQEFKEKNVNLDNGNIDIDQENYKLEITINNYIGQTYIAIGDYRSAYNVLQEAWNNLNEIDDVELATGLTLEETLTLSILEIYIKMGEIERAEKLFAPMINEYYGQKTANGMISIYKIELAIGKKEPVFARQVFNENVGLLEELAEKYRQKDIHYDNIFFDAKINILENKNDLALKKLNYVIKNSNNYSTVRKSKEYL